MDKITGVLDALQGIFGKGFVLAGFLPITLLLTISWLLGCWLSPACRDFSQYLIQMHFLQQFVILVIALLLTSMLSFIFWQLNAWFRQLLEGRLWPRRVQEWLTVEQRDACSDLENQIQDFMNEVFSYRKAIAVWPAQLAAGRVGTGDTIQDAGLVADYEKLEHRFEGSRNIPYKDTEAFYRRLLAEMRLTSQQSVAKLAEMQKNLRDKFLPRGKAMAEHQVSRLLPKRYLGFPSDESSIGPTRLANVQEAQRDLLIRSYGIDATVFWADLQEVAGQHASFAETLGNAKMRLDFSVALTAISMIFTLGWVLLSALFGTAVIIYCCGVAIGIALVAISHQLVGINNETFVEVVRTTVELYRFDLLRAMHLPLPADSLKEEETWTALIQRLQLGNGRKLTYEHA